ncbi:hypothetical protein BASA50_001560 [Batrachochytrium salamandrivorans]|uniref:RRM domain-containing protein n=1 Tax=Batrachochytrium salamandrivorans TaxID=1357716 RepID=A0ABQ8FNX0_9FUNG|nr:hypothetical protein BASA62_003609 [Batrachochytrium salamandrivorans]KAH6573005.1 hypothetical protein BASA60_006276 [Batrachochytrium salamandrivorans]KAH6597592.1 hypothetical protein BASA61_003092 [Batrachochytrium salamandrivorans]KAH6601522.1 hypothetical protein BASA50_001560 [Batrachochytrium salamandrivorans]KAH9249929.1 hypothetical protein BASA81_012306 [Batrachochytrium salamandrivorans]
MAPKRRRQQRLQEDLPRPERVLQVITIQNESSILVVSNVPAIKVADELRHRFSYFGGTLGVDQLKDYPAEDFTEAYLIRYADMSCAREAKEKMKGASFYGSLLKVRYGPEFESVDEKRLKMLSRIRNVTSRI